MKRSTKRNTEIGMVVANAIFIVTIILNWAWGWIIPEGVQSAAITLVNFIVMMILGFSPNENG